MWVERGFFVICGLSCRCCRSLESTLPCHAATPHVTSPTQSVLHRHFISILKDSLVMRPLVVGLIAWAQSLGMLIWQSSFYRHICNWIVADLDLRVWPLRWTCALFCLCGYWFIWFLPLSFIFAQFLSFLPRSLVVHYFPFVGLASGHLLWWTFVCLFHSMTY